MVVKKKKVAKPKEQPEEAKESSSAELFVGFPCYKQTNPATAWCLLAIAKDFGSKVRFDMQIGDAMIYHARNELAMKFLATDAKWLLFIDDDMIIPIGRSGFIKQIARLPADYPEKAASLNTVTRLVSHDLDIVGATYFSRNSDGFAINSLNNDNEYGSRVTQFKDSVLPCKWIGTGCMLIRRNVFETMMEKFPELAPSNDKMPWNFFQPMEDGRGEDIAFCARAVECGFQPHVDTMLHAIHVGYGTYGVHTSRLNRVML
jgi:hypothetical protein